MKIFYTVFIILFFSFMNINSYAQWSQNGPAGGVVYTLSARENGIIYAGTCSGIYLSNNLGQIWQKGYNNLESKKIKSIAYWDAMSFATDEQGYFYYSLDSGYNWTNRSYYPGMQVIAANNSIIYCGGTKFSSSGGVSNSTNYGVSWNSMNLSNSLSIYDLMISGYYIYAAGDSGVYRSSTIGTSWEYLKNGFPPDVIVYSLKSDLLNIYAGTNRGVFRSTNNGSSWFSINNGISTTWPYYTLEINNGVLFAAEYSTGIFKSTNSGNSWIACNSGLKDNLIYKLLSFNNNLFASSLGEGVYVTADSGTTWYSKNTNLFSHIIYTMCVNENTLLAGTQGGGVFVSNNGVDWTNYNYGLENTIVYSIISANNNLYASTYGGIFKSSNGGYNWSAKNNGLLDSVVLVLTSNETSIFAGTQGDGLYKSDNWGDNWYKANNGITCDTIKSLSNLNNILYAGTNSQGIYRSTNSGENWTQCNSGFPRIPLVLSFAKNDSTIYAGAYAPYPYHGLYKSTNYGLNWTQILSSNYILGIAIYNNAIFTELYGTTSGGNIWMSTNNGITWNNISFLPGVGNPWGSSDLRSLITYNEKLFVGTYGKSIHSKKINQIITDAGKNNPYIPDGFALMQNFPNPFNANTIIKYTIKDSKQVTLKVYDIRGLEVKTLVNQMQTAGTYEINFDGSNLSSGIYFYRIYAGDFENIKKMMLIK
jgi:photosystem II stability/assembly factor-like uncharacterized protein